MGFRLKDKHFQKQLDEISNGDFSKALSRKSNNRIRHDTLVKVRFGERIGEENAPKAFVAFFWSCELKWVKDDKETQ